MNRRGFLASLLRSLLAGSVLAQGGCARLRVDDRTPPPPPVMRKSLLSPAQWVTVAAVQAHLLPSEPGKPGADEINALHYLRLLLADPDPEKTRIRFVATGVETLETLCMQHYNRHFPALSAEQAELVLREFERSAAGAYWLTEMLEFLLEALLGDPSYQINPDGIGWRWLDITPGFPRPPVRAS